MLNEKSDWAKNVEDAKKKTTTIASLVLPRRTELAKITTNILTPPPNFVNFKTTINEHPVPNAMPITYDYVSIFNNKIQQIRDFFTVLFAARMNNLNFIIIYIY